MSIDLDTNDHRLLNAAQQNFPLCTRPWEALGKPLGLSEIQVIQRFQRLTEGRVLRQISAIFDSKALGYRSALVAAQAPAAQIETCAGEVSAHAGVSHNYQRDHEFNLWFTLACPPNLNLQEEADRLGQRAGLTQWHVMPATKTYRIGVSFDLEKAQATAMPSINLLRSQGPLALLTAKDQAAVRALQENLALEREPFLPIAKSLGLSEAELFDWMVYASEQRWLRRYAAVLRHREAGFGEGGMGVWAVVPEQAEKLGRAFAKYPAVTHCYQRPTFDGWPYSLFTMVHGKDRQDCQAVIDRMAQETPGWTQRSVLFSTREFKKERVRYFLENVAASVPTQGVIRPCC